MSSPSPNSSTPTATPAGIETPTTETYLQVAQAIAARLARLAVWDGPRCTWVGSAVDAVHGSYQVVHRAFGTDVYSGTAGIARFLGLVLTQAPDPVLAKVLDGAVAHVLSDEALAEGPAAYGYFGGALGVAATLIELGDSLHRPEWTAAGWKRLAASCSRVPLETEVDVIGGVAGAIPVLLKLLTRRNEPWLRTAIVRAGDFLVSQAQRAGSTWAWAALPGQPALTGYSHGAAGIALALLELYRETGNPVYFAGAMGGFSFERQHYNAHLQNWPDLRPPTTPPTTGTAPAPTYGEAWCHGAPGIALSRLRAWQLTGDASLRQEAETALNTTHRGIHALVTGGSTAPAGFSLCHGLAGNADILLEGSRVLSNDLYRQVAEAAGNYGLARYHDPGLRWPSGVNDPTSTTADLPETPGLMLGLAGTGYFYLRLARPDSIPSLLLL